MTIPFSVGDIIAGLELSHSMRAGRKDVWHQLKILEISEPRMKVQMINPLPPLDVFWVIYNPNYFKEIKD